MPQRQDPGNIIAVIMVLVALALPILLGIANHVHGSTIVPADASKNISWPFQTFKTANYTPPVIKVTGEPSLDPQDGHLFFAPDGGTAYQKAPIIASADGELIWNGPIGKAFGFDVQTYKGADVLVYWNGTSFPEPVGRGHGSIHVLGKDYEEIAKVSLQGNFVDLTEGEMFESNIDLHEMYLTEKGTILVLGNNVTQTDLRSVGGTERGWLVEAQVYEIDVETNEVLFSWKSLEHLDELPLEASVYPLGSEGYDGSEQSKAWGYIHINSVAPLRDGYILSSRYLSSAIALDKSGKVLWRVQGIDGNDFTLGKGADFRYQHHIRTIAEHDSCVVLRLHDNHNCPIDNNTVPASGKFLKVDLKNKHVSLLGTKYYNPADPIYPTAQGSFAEVSKSGNFFTGNGWIPILEEFSPDGKTIATYQFGNATANPNGSGFVSGERGTLSYRGFKRRWTGCPQTKPVVVLEYTGPSDAPAGTRAYISWNGATEVKAWELYGGIETVSYIRTVEKKGFETVIDMEVIQFLKVKAVLRSNTCGKDAQLESELAFPS
ncbi:putative arylsulfotransferase [Septoria linicola]|nr:putative arylsulfotransferase [Septoria linicola]